MANNLLLSEGAVGMNLILKYSHYLGDKNERVIRKNDKRVNGCSKGRRCGYIRK